MTNLTATSFIKSGVNLSGFDGAAFEDINAADPSAVQGNVQAALNACVAVPGRFAVAHGGDAGAVL